MSVNKVILLGNVGRDPEIRHTRSGEGIANLSIATSESWTDKRSGERQERTEWHRVVVFNTKLVAVIEKYVKKGTSLYVEGQVQTRKWTGQDGVERVTTEVVLPSLGGKLQIVGQPSGSRQQPRPSQNDLDDAIPF